MRHFIVCVVLTFIPSLCIEAAEISLIQEHEIGKPVVPISEEEAEQTPKSMPQNVESVPNIEEDPEYQEMKQFMRLENEKIKQIKMLNLDLERADLELKKREIQSKIDQIAKSEMFQGSPLNAAQNMDVPITVAGILKINDGYQALIKINGQLLSLKQGQKIHDGWSVKMINDQSVTLANSEGKESTYMMGL